MAEVLIEDAPRKARDLYDKGFAALERGNMDYAMDMFTASLEIEPRLLKARKFLRAAAIKKFKDGKGGPITHLISSITGAIPVMMASGQIKKKPEQALKTAEKLLRRDPLNMTFINLLGKAAVSADMPEVAIQTLEIAKDHNPKDITLLNWLAQLYIDTNQPQKARECYETVVHLKPNDQKAIKALKDAAALATMKKGGWDDAGSYRDVMKDSKEATLLEQQSKAVKSEKNLETLIKELTGTVQREPDNINAIRQLADLLTRAERFDEALNLLKQTQEAQGRGDPQIDRAITAIHVQQFDHQINALKEAGDEEGAAAKEKEKEEFLLANAASRVKSYPNDLQFRYEYGVLLYKRGQLNEAIEEFQLSQRNPQRRIRSLYYLAMCFKQKKQYDIAMEQLQKAASELHIMDDTKKDIFYEMGSIYELMGDAENAAKHFKEIYSVDIKYKDVAEKIEKVYSK